MSTLTVPEVLSRYSPEQLKKLVTYLSPQESRQVEEIIEDWQCSVDPLYWGQHYTKTENKHYEQQGVPFKAPFPNKSYFNVVMEHLEKERLIFIPKSREMLTSWLVVLFAANKAQWHKWEVVFQSEKESKSQDLIKYAQILYENQPDWLKAKHPLDGGFSTEKIAWKSGGRIFGVAKGADQVRSYHPTLVVFDELAFLSEAEATFNTAKPVVPRIIGISTANQGWFGNMCQR